METAKDEQRSERFRRMPDLVAAIVLTWDDVALYLDLPVSTLNMLRSQGRGPRTFRLGRRLYVSRADLLKWLTQMAETEALP
jgi:hypothetical protein